MPRRGTLCRHVDQSVRQLIGLGWPSPYKVISHLGKRGNFSRGIQHTVSLNNIKGAFHPEILVVSQMEGPFRFLPTGIFGTTSGGGPLCPVGSEFAVPFLTNQFTALLLFASVGNSENE